MEFTGVFSALISFTSVVIWYNFEFILSDFLSGFSFCSHFFCTCFFLGAVDSSTSNCLDGDLAPKEGDGGRRCLGPLLCFERDLLDDVYLFGSLDEDLSLGLGLSLESDRLCLSELVFLSLS